MIEGQEAEQVMKRSKYSQAQTAIVLKQGEDGTTVGEVCNKMGFSEATFYACRRVQRCPSVAAGAKPHAREFRQARILQEATSGYYVRADLDHPFKR